MVEKPLVSAFQNFLWIENWLNIKKVMGRNVFCIDSVDIDSIECIRDPCPVLTVSTYIVLMVWLKSTQSQLSKTFCRLNALEILIPYVDSVYRVEFSHFITLCTVLCKSCKHQYRQC